MVLAMIQPVVRSNASCQLLRGDCMERLAAFSPASIDAVITDHPYGSTDCSWDQRVDLAAWWEQIDRVTVDAAIVACFAAQPFATDLINSRRKSFRYELVWDKVSPVGFLNANRQPMRVHELLLVFCRRPGRSIYRPQFRPGTPYTRRAKVDRSSVYRSHGAVATINPGRRHPLSILRFPKPMGRARLHPTEKPVDLLTWMVLSYTLPGMRILDPFMGSGSAGEAALRQGRHFIGIEKDPAIFRAAARRLSPLSPDRLIDGRSKPVRAAVKPPIFARTLRAARTFRSALPARQRASKVRAFRKSALQPTGFRKSPTMRRKAAVAPVAPKDSASLVRENPG